MDGAMRLCRICRMAATSLRKSGGSMGEFIDHRFSFYFTHHNNNLKVFADEAFGRTDGSIRILKPL